MPPRLTLRLGAQNPEPEPRWESSLDDNDTGDEAHWQNDDAEDSASDDLEHAEDAYGDRGLRGGRARRAYSAGTDNTRRSLENGKRRRIDTVPSPSDANHVQNTDSYEDHDDEDDGPVIRGRRLRSGRQVSLRPSYTDHEISIANNFDDMNSGDGGDDASSMHRSSSQLLSTNGRYPARSSRLTLIAPVPAATIHAIHAVHPDSGRLIRTLRSRAGVVEEEVASTLVYAEAPKSGRSLRPRRPPATSASRHDGDGDDDSDYEEHLTRNRGAQREPTPEIPEYVPAGREGLRRRPAYDYHQLESGIKRPRKLTQYDESQDLHNDESTERRPTRRAARRSDANSEQEYNPQNDQEDDSDPQSELRRTRGNRFDYTHLFAPKELLRSNGRRERGGEHGKTSSAVSAAARRMINEIGATSRNRRPTGSHQNDKSAFIGGQGDSDSDMAPGIPGRQPELHRILPLNVDEMDAIRGPPGIKRRAALADVDPLGVGSSVSFDSVGGLDQHIRGLKEMVMLPLLYPELFAAKKIQPPRGVIFHGPPGTGKTLLARALASSCSTSNQKIAFFMRKGADCLSKWVGEAERQLRLLFDAAKLWQPSIIFFDEIDGLTPVRSSRQDQVHASIVSTLLALMDGLDSRGQVIVIGATNRIDAIDPALRRPGRFDREFYFPLPNEEARARILDIQTTDWEPNLDSSFKASLARASKGYCGADVKALCTEAALRAIRRRYPQVYTSAHKLVIDPASVQVSEADFVSVMKSSAAYCQWLLTNTVVDLVPASHRSVASPALPLKAGIDILLGSSWDRACQLVRRQMPGSAWEKVAGNADDDTAASLEDMMHSRSYKPRLLISGCEGMGQKLLGSALLHSLEGCHVSNFDLGVLVSETVKSPESACVQLFSEARRHQPSVLYVPCIDTWLEALPETFMSVFSNLLRNLAPHDPIMLLGTCECPAQELPLQVRLWFEGAGRGTCVEMTSADAEIRRQFFDEIRCDIFKPPPPPKKTVAVEELARAPTPPPKPPTEAERKAQEKHERTAMARFRFAIGSILKENRKLNRQLWTIDLHPYELKSQTRSTKHLPLDLEAILDKSLRLHGAEGGYIGREEYLDDLEQFRSNVLSLFRLSSAIIQEYTADEYHRWLNVREQVGRLMDSVMNDMDQFPDDLWESADIASERLRFKKQNGMPVIEEETDRRAKALKQLLEGRKRSREMSYDELTANANDAGESSDVRLASDDDQDDVTMSEPRVGDSDEVMVIDNSRGEHDAGPAVQPSDEAVVDEEPSLQTLIVDQAAVNAFFTGELVRATSELNVDALDRTRTGLGSVVLSYRCVWDRSRMLAELRAIVDEVVELAGLLEAQHDEVEESTGL